VQTLNQYSGVLDIVAQWHPEYSALVWGSIKWLLLIAMNYISLAQRIADMLEEIGDNLPRFLLYQQLLPTSRMSQVISKLYAAVIEFLYCTIIYFHRSRIRRYFSALWVPFETRFKDTMDRIQRLQVCVENDARATATAQQQIESTDFARQLSELALTTRVTLQSILDVKQRQTAMLLMDTGKIFLLVVITTSSSRKRSWTSIRVSLRLSGRYGYWKTPNTWQAIATSGQA
jgi:hypothetical protein